MLTLNLFLFWAKTYSIISVIKKKENQMKYINFKFVFIVACKLSFIVIIQAPIEKLRDEFTNNGLWLLIAS